MFGVEAESVHLVLTSPPYWSLKWELVGNHHTRAKDPATVTRSGAMVVLRPVWNPVRRVNTRREIAQLSGSVQNQADAAADKAG